MLVAFSVLSYALRMNIAIAQQSMARELGLSDFELGQIFSAFMLAYAVFQIPAGIWGDRCGARLVLTVAAVNWFLATLLTGLVPGILATGSAAFVSILGLRFFLGVGEAATYPVAARAIASWVPSGERTFSNSLMFAGCTAGAALTPPLIAYVMEEFGWRAAFYLSSLLPLLLAVIWWLESRDTPQDYGAVNDGELAMILAGRPPGYYDTARSVWRALTGNRNVALLALSYFFDSYVVFIFLFWLFKYLVDVRKFSVGGGGWATAVPYLGRFHRSSPAWPLYGPPLQPDRYAAWPENGRHDLPAVFRRAPVHRRQSGERLAGGRYHIAQRQLFAKHGRSLLVDGDRRGRSVRGGHRRAAEHRGEPGRRGLDIINAGSGSCVRLGGRLSFGVPVRIFRLDSVAAGRSGSSQTGNRSASHDARYRMRFVCNGVPVSFRQGDTVLTFERLRLLRVVAAPAVLDKAIWPEGAIAMRTAPDGVLALADGAPDLPNDPHAIVEPEEGFAALWLTAREALDLLERKSCWELPDRRPAFAQGAVAGIPTKLWFDHGRVLFLVPAPYAADRLA
jgi:MFS family permease